MLMRPMVRGYKLVSILLLLALASGCATVSAPNKRDPWESYNRSIFEFNQGFDNAIGKPVAEAYQYVLPNFMQTGITNFFNNLNDIVVIVNDFLQFKFTQGLADLNRLVYNTTFGLLGFIDVASHMDLPKHNEDFGQTLAVWGVGSGPYFVLPFLGPNTVRDTTGLIVDTVYLNPLVNLKDDEIRWGLIALSAIDKRASLLEASRIMEKSGIDPYVFMRNAYFQVRENQIYDGNPPGKKYNIKPTQDDLELEQELEKELQLEAPK